VGSDGWTTVRAAWDAALYGANGFYRVERPGAHFRTSAHVAGDFAAAVLAVAHRAGAMTVVDVGAGEGELLTALRELDPDLGLVGVDIRPRPAGLPPTVDWLRSEADTASVAAAANGRALLIANELLDNVPCDLVELADDGLRDVEVEAASGRDRIGGPADPAVAAWTQRWWPLDVVGQRAVAGLARDALWERLCAGIDDGVCVAVDYGHVLAERPGGGALRSYRGGRERRLAFDARHDITADVAVDSVASAVGARLARQRQVVEGLVPAAQRPGLELARSDPTGYLRRLSAAGDRRELVESGGLGDFWWIVSGRDACASEPPLALGSEVAR
jgi:SAM-dependent MidA family methyltransferase